MLKKSILLFTAFNISCSIDDQNVISTLKNTGYIEITCNNIKRYNSNEFSFIEINKTLSHNKDFVLARCFESNRCFFDMNYNKNKITCQRYFSRKNSSIKIDYLDNMHKEFLNHRVLCYTVRKED
jgi:hypothetical protein